MAMHLKFRFSKTFDNPYFFSFSVLFLIAASMGISGCRYPFTQGHFEGNLYTYENSQVKVQPVGMNISYAHHRFARHHNEGTVEIRDQDKNLLHTLKVTRHSSKKVDLTIPLLREQPFTLIKYKNCFLDHSEYLLDVCFDRNNFVVRASKKNSDPVFTLTATLFLKETDFRFEPPISLTLSQAISRALERSFESRIQLEHSVQVKKGSQLAFLSLLPRVNFGALAWTAMSASDPVLSIINTLAMMGDYIPFFLPSRWIQAKSSRIMVEADRVSYSIMLANLVSQVETLAYFYERDSMTVETFDLVLEKILDLEQTAPHHAQKFKEMAQALAYSREEARSVVRADRYALAQSLGFYNPDSIKEITLDPEPSLILDAKMLDPREFALMASQRSLEVKQIDILVKVARNEKLLLWFSWLDPQGDPSANLGFGLIPQFQIANSKRKSLLLQREQLLSTVVHKSFDGVNAYNSILKHFGYIGDVNLKRISRLEDAFSQAKEGAIEPHVLHGIINEFMEAKIKKLGMICNFRVARSKLDRLSLQGHYINLFPKLSLPPEEDKGKGKKD